VIEKTIGFRVTPEAEAEGVDLHEHAEAGYDFSTAGPSLVGAGAPAAPAKPADAPASEKVAG
jgi:Amt family ammonium transporter